MLLLRRGILQAGNYGLRHTFRKGPVLGQFQCWSSSANTTNITNFVARTKSKLLLPEYGRNYNQVVRPLSLSSMLYMPKLPFESLVSGRHYPDQSTRVHLVGLQGESLGETTAGQAVQTAIKHQCKVVLVGNDQTNTPLCKLMTGKTYAEEETRLRKEGHGKKPAKTHQLQIGSKITDHDLHIKVAHTRQLLRKGSPIRVTLKNTSRDGTDKGMVAVFEKVIEACKEDATVQKVNKTSMAVWTFLLAPCQEAEPVPASANQQRQ